MTDQIKEAFAKVKEDILNLKAQLDSLSRELSSLRNTLSSSINQQTDRQSDTSTDNPPSLNYQTPALRQTQDSQKQTLQHINKTNTPIPAQSSTDNSPFKVLKSQDTYISTGNGGVSTDRQTDRQTDTSTRNQGVKVRLIDELPLKTSKIDQMEKVSQVLNSLDTIKKDLRHKFKHLTNQEFLVFSTIYQLEEEGFPIDYSILAQKLSLTESSIRDYIQRMTKKSIPIEKTKENNKKILLSISPELKKIASLSTIISLRSI